MPIDYSKYPPNWKSLAIEIKDRSLWICQECDRPCRRPGQDWQIFVDNLPKKWKEQFFDCVNGVTVIKKQRFTLTVAHLDHDTQNNSPENLRALCSVCHLRYDSNHHAQNAKLTRQRKIKSTCNIPLKGL